jgi:hypothetical protein
MGYQLWSQDIFSKGEISPLLYSRVSIAPYYNGLKRAKNVITFPQGAAGKRFGTVFQNFVPDVTDASQIYFKAMQYLNECIYLMCFTPENLNIYLEGILVAQIATPIGANELQLIDHTVLDNIFRVTTGVLAPQDVTRSASTPNVIASVTTTELNLTTAVATGLILPARFTTSNTLPVTTPQLLANRTYFVRYTSTTTAKIYSTALDAKADVNAFSITNNGVGTNNLVVLNSWSIDATVFENMPTYDFNDNDYDALTFTPTATIGFGIDLTASGSIFLPGGSTTGNSPYIGGFFEGNSGRARIVSITSATVAKMDIVNPFDSTAAIPGKQSYLAQVAWSDIRGWPRCCSSFQNRAFFANSDSLPNGLWGSVTNDYNNFDDIETDPDNAISWYPTSDDITFIRFIVPYRSLTIHTNSGVFSTPLSVEQAITPLNFSLTIQDSTPAEAVQPRGIDNQIIILSGNDAHSLLWDGFNNAYQSNIISIANEQLIRSPVDEAAYVDLNRAGSRYMLIVNADGSLAIYQTLISEDAQGFTPAYVEQPYGNAYFRWVTTTPDGRGWFVCERELAVENAAVPITGYGATFLFAAGSDFSITEPTAVQFSSTTALPSGTPALTTDTWFWAVGIDSDNFMVFETIDDARLLLNQIAFTDYGNGASVIPFKLATFFSIEELSFEMKVDFATTYDGAPENTFTDLDYYNAQVVKINGDGYGFVYTGINDTVKTIAHGELTDVSVAQIGFPINVEIEPLPLSIFGTSPKTSNLMTPTHIRSATFMFSDTIGGEINGIPIALQNFDEVQIGAPPEPTNGIFEMSLMGGWDDYKNIGISITHSEPFDIKLIGIFYKVEA